MSSAEVVVVGPPSVRNNLPDACSPDWRTIQRCLSVVVVVVVVVAVAAAAAVVGCVG